MAALVKFNIMIEQKVFFTQAPHVIDTDESRNMNRTVAARPTSTYSKCVTPKRPAIAT